VQNFLPRIVGELTSCISTIPFTRSAYRPARLIIFQLLVGISRVRSRPVDGLGDLRCHGHDLKDWRHEKAQKDIDEKKFPASSARKNLVRGRVP